MLVGCCNNSTLLLTNDGNKHQKCLNCGKKWDAPEEPDTSEADNDDINIQVNESNSQF
jgi:hypothetical protein